MKLNGIIRGVAGQIKKNKNNNNTTCRSSGLGHYYLEHNIKKLKTKMLKLIRVSSGKLREALPIIIEGQRA